MDVRCERCRAQYVFDDAQVTEAGLTVQCSNCGHLFKVKKKALVVTVPVKPGEATDVPAITPTATASAAGAHAPPPHVTPTEKREWRVRQANGNVFTFKELTTLQKWIVERKVSRDDEISLSGDQWKRLGNIAELASFFQVVEAADRSQAQSAPTVITPLPVPTVFPTGTGGYPVGYPPPAAYPATTPVPHAGGPTAPMPGSLHGSASAPAPSAAWEAHSPSVPRAAGREPAWTSGPRVDLDEALGKEELRAVQRGGGGKLLLTFLLLGAAGAAAVWFLAPEWVPESLRAKATAVPPVPAAQAPSTTEVRPEPPPAPPKPAAPAPPAPVAAAPPPPAPVPPAPVATTPPAAVTAPPAVVATAPPAAAPAPVPASPKEEPPAPVEKAPPAAKEAPRAAKEVPKPKGAKGLVAEAKRLRERGKTEKALDLFGRAVELDPENAEALAGRGWCYLDLSQYAPAEASFQGALEQQPDHADALIGLAETFRYEGRRAEALKYYERYLAIHPGGDDAVAARNAINQLKE